MGFRPCVWKGWKRAIDEELYAAGGALPWKKLRAKLVARYNKAMAAVGGTSHNDCDDQVGYSALANIPEAYLSKQDRLVRLPGCCSSSGMIESPRRVRQKRECSYKR